MIDHDDRQRQQEEYVAEHVDAVAHRLGSMVLTMSMRMCSFDRSVHGEHSRRSLRTAPIAVRARRSTRCRRPFAPWRWSRKRSPRPGSTRTGLCRSEVDRVDAAAQLEQTLHDRSPCCGSKMPLGCIPSVGPGSRPGRGSFLDGRRTSIGKTDDRGRAQGDRGKTVGKTEKRGSCPAPSVRRRPP